MAGSFTWRVQSSGNNQNISAETFNAILVYWMGKGTIIRMITIISAVKGNMWKYVCGDCLYTGESLYSMCVWTYDGLCIEGRGELGEYWLLMFSQSYSLLWEWRQEEIRGWHNPCNLRKQKLSSSRSLQRTDWPLDKAGHTHTGWNPTVPERSSSPYHFWSHIWTQRQQSRWG